MSSFISLLVVLLGTLTGVFAQDTVVVPGSAIDPTNNGYNPNLPVSNIIDGNWQSPGWNPTVADITVPNYFYAQFNWPSAPLGGFNTSNLLVTSFTVSMAGDDVHTPSLIGVIPNGVNVAKAIQTWPVSTPGPQVARFNMTFTFDQPQPLSNFTVFFYNSHVSGTFYYQVYVFQIQFLTFKAVTPVNVIDPTNNIPSCADCAVGNLLVPNTSLWNPSYPPGDQSYKTFYNVFTLPPLGKGLVHNVTGFQIWTTLDGDHTLSQTGLSLGYQNDTSKVLQNFSVGSISPDASGQPNGWPEGWASFSLSSSVLGHQFSLFYYNGNHPYQVYLLGVRFYTSSNPVCDAGYYNSASAGSPATCTVCPIGTFSAQAGSTTCSSCPTGTYQNTPGSTSCDVCPTGTYQNATGSTSCSVCPAGTSFHGSGASSCSFCKPGYYSAVGSATCLACSPGSYAPSWASSSCTMCPPGQYASAWASTTCSVCPSNTLSPAGSTTIKACDACPKGTSGGGMIPVCCPNGPSANGVALAKFGFNLARFYPTNNCLMNSIANNDITGCSASSVVNYVNEFNDLLNEYAAVVPSQSMYCSNSKEASE